MAILGIDGGGTKTHFALFNDTGEIICECKRGSASHWQFTDEQIEETLYSGLNEILEIASITKNDISKVVFGMSGFGEDSGKDQSTITLCKKIFGENIVYVNDGVLGLVASLGGKAGINVVAGTGTIAFGIDEKNNITRCGGWGHKIGDEGSGYWLGRKAVELFTKESDGRIPRTEIHELIKNYFKLENDFDIIAIMEDLILNRTELGKLQMLLSKAANNGDEQALNIYNQATDELILLVNFFSDKIESKVVSYSGGIFKTGDFFVENFINKLEKQNYTCQQPMFEPIYGAYLIAISEQEFTFNV